MGRMRQLSKQVLILVVTVVGILSMPAMIYPGDATVARSEFTWLTETVRAHYASQNFFFFP